jgi:hypothetical protein
MPDLIVPSAITRALSELLSTKHLYQSVHIKWEELKPHIDHNPLTVRDSWQRIGHENLFGFWRFKEDPPDLKGYPVECPSTVSTFCGNCGKQQPHNPHRDVPPRNADSRLAQVLCIPVECQGCKLASVVFLVSRQNTHDSVRLQLTGRSVFEQVEVPSYIPKDQRRYYSDAVIAFNSGQTLPALFMLRTLIELHAQRPIAKQELRGDELCDEYAKGLNENFKASFPSFKEIYGLLSDTLHSARADQELFESELKRIENHFSGKQAFDDARKLRMERPGQKDDS